MRAALGVGNSRPVRRVGEEKPIQPHTATSVWLNQGKNKQVRLFLSSPDTFNAFRISERMHDPVHTLTPLCDGLTAHLVESDV